MEPIKNHDPQSIDPSHLGLIIVLRDGRAGRLLLLFMIPCEIGFLESIKQHGSVAHKVERQGTTLVGAQGFELSCQPLETTHCVVLIIIIVVIALVACVSSHVGLCLLRQFEPESIILLRQHGVKIRFGFDTIFEHVMTLTKTEHLVKGRWFMQGCAGLAIFILKLHRCVGQSKMAFQIHLLDELLIDVSVEPSLQCLWVHDQTMTFGKLSDPHLDVEIIPEPISRDVDALHEGINWLGLTERHDDVGKYGVLETQHAPNQSMYQTIFIQMFA